MARLESVWYVSRSGAGNTRKPRCLLRLAMIGQEGHKAAEYEFSESDLMSQAANRFDFIRLFLAVCVFLFHGISVTGVTEGSAIEIGLGRLAELSIQGFFIVSGLLVSGSLERASGLSDYVGKRFRRLYPAYIAVILVPALLSLLLTQDWRGVASYLGANLVFLNFLSPDLPGLFHNNRFTEVNASLWTLKIEVMFYVALPLILFVLNRMKSFWWAGVILLYLGGQAWAMLVPLYLEGNAGEQLARQLPGQMPFFAMGIALWKASPGIRRRWASMALCGTVLLGATFLHPPLESLRALALAGVIGAVAWAPGPQINAARFGDVSYGLYITHFPILQALAAAGLVSVAGLPGFLMLGAALTLTASLALWHFVEKPALRPTSHYRRVASES